MNPHERARVTRDLLAWYRREKRDLPWRRTKDPYRIWVSEVMLQQTRVETVKPYYERFLARFPTVGALALAQLDDVLLLFSGLGYYARARSLHRAAVVVVEQHGGLLPRDPEELASLPGFGPYTTAAVASIAFGADLAVVDGNVARVLSRLLAYRGETKGASALSGLREMAQGYLPRGQAGDFNQAMMELGAMICTPGEPACQSCPVALHCLARRQGLEREIPLRRKGRDRPRLQMAAAYIQRGDSLLLARRRDEGLFASLWELPSASVAEGADERVALEESLKQMLGLRIAIGEKLGVVEQTLTHRELSLSVFAAEPTVRYRKALAPEGDYVDARFAPPDKPPGGLSSVTKKALSQVRNKRERR